MVLSGAAALVLWLLVWCREREARSWLPLAVMTVAWIGCHLFVSPLGRQFPPKQPEDWLVYGSAAVFLLAVTAWRVRGRDIPVSALSALLMAGAAWLALRQLPYLLDRDESAEQRQLWMATGVAGLGVTFFSAERVARRVSPAALFAGMAVFAGLAALGLWRMASPEQMVARPLAAAAVALAGMVAALTRRKVAAVPRGAAGWFCGGVLLLFTFGCLSRAANVPVWPIVAAAAALPAAALLAQLHGRWFLTGHGLTFIAAMLLCGSLVLLLCARDQARLESAPPVLPTVGADDTGAYD